MDLTPTSLLGVVLTLGAATSFAIQYLCVRIGTADGSVSDIMLVSLLCNVFLVVPVAGIIYYPAYGITVRSLLAFLAAGIIGSLLARVLEYKSVEQIGASRTSPLVASNTLFATVLAIVFLDETLTGIHGLGIVLVVSGVAGLAIETGLESRGVHSFREAGVVLVVPLLAALFIALEPIVVAVGYRDGTAVLPGFALKAIAGLCGFLGYRWWRREELFGRILQRPSLKWYIGVGIANTVGIGLYFAALAVAPVVIVMPLLQTAPLIVVALSILFLPGHLERTSWQLLLAIAVIVVGAMLVSVS